MDVISFSCYPLVLNLKGGNMEERQVVDEDAVTIQVDVAIDSMLDDERIRRRRGDSGTSHYPSNAESSPMTPTSHEYVWRDRLTPFLN
jgi:hypothetical protein